MYVLEFLKAAIEGRIGEVVHVEHRLLCSGELYNRRVVAIDWRKSEITRVLLRDPFELYVASQPFAAFPQEICVRLALPYVTEQDGDDNFSAMRIFLPDDEVVEDLCSILSLLSRRLISPYVKTREQHPSTRERQAALGSYSADVPMPVGANRRRSAWNPRPAMVFTSPEGQTVIDQAPRPVGVDDGSLAGFLKRLPSAPFAKQIVSASRLYRTALEMIETRADIAYQLLISTVECLAGAVLMKFEPTDEEKLRTKQSVSHQAIKYGLDEARANALALLACQGMAWTKLKFVKFLMDRLTQTDLAKKDTLFMTPKQFCPPPDEAERALGLIYAARSGNLHGGVGFPSTIGIGTSPSIHFRQMPLNPLKSPEIPPVTWFERMVSLAAVKFMLEQTEVSAAPFLERGAQDAAITDF